MGLKTNVQVVVRHWSLVKAIWALSRFWNVAVSLTLHQNSQLDQPHNEEKTNREIRAANREIRTTVENQNINRIIRNYQQKQSLTIANPPGGGGKWNVEVKIPIHIELTTSNRKLLDHIYKQTLIDFCLIYVATLDIIH